MDEVFIKRSSFDEFLQNIALKNRSIISRYNIASYLDNEIEINYKCEN